MYRHPIVLLEPNDARYEALNESLHPFVADRLRRVRSVADAIGPSGLVPASLYLVPANLELGAVLELLVHWRADGQPSPIMALGRFRGSRRVLLNRLGLLVELPVERALSHRLLSAVAARTSRPPITHPGC